MRRHRLEPRRKWQQTVESQGLSYHTLADGSPYWDESAYWEFSAEEVDRLEAATVELQTMALAAGDRILEQKRLEQMGIPLEAHQAIRAAWNSEPPALYGRFDLAYDGREIKLLEFNADTPTSLLESAVIQWYWLEDRFPDDDQFNSIHEKLIEKWRDLGHYMPSPLYFTAANAEEDLMTIAYLEDTAQQAGLKTRHLAINDIGWHHQKRCFVDLDAQPIEALFKLYPWEAMLAEPFGMEALSTMPPAAMLRPYGPPDDRRSWGSVLWIEPIWKLMWSNKALLAILWEMYPNHELLLPAYFDDPHGMREYVRKPFFGREGSGISLYREAQIVAGNPAPDSSQPAVYQQLAQMAKADGRTAVLGSWVVDGEAAGMGIRESAGPITANTSTFVPHLFR